MSRWFIFTQASLPGVWIAQRNVLEDDRGSFGRVFCAVEFEEIGLNKPIVQINRSITRMKGSVRGLHFQRPPYAETKIISCIKGEVFDVAVDLRHNSKTFLSWHGEILSSKNNKTIVIPEGFAHGFQTLTDDCELLYFHTGLYTSEAEGGLNVEDQRIGINWPLPVNGLSERDRSFVFISDDYTGERL